MGQGSINQFQAPQHSPIEGVMRALEAVHSYYGIDTERQKQALQDIQLKEAQQLAQEKEHYTQSGEMGPMMALAAGRYLTPSQMQGTDNKETQSPLLAAIRGTAVGTQPTSTDITLPSTPQNAAGTQPVAGSLPVRLGSGALTYAEPDLKVQQEQANLKKTNQEIDMAIPKNIQELQKTFNEYTPVKQAKEDMDTANLISKGMTSGNKQFEQLAKARLALFAVGIKRLNEGGMQLTEDPGFINSILNKMSLRGVGHLTPDERHSINQVALQLGENAQNTYNSQASDMGAQAAATVKGETPESFKSKYLTPQGGLSFQGTQSAVKQGKLWRRDKKGWLPAISE